MERAHKSEAEGRQAIMATEYITISVSMPAETLEMLKQIARWRFDRQDRVISLTVDQIIREVYEQEQRKHRKE